MSGREHVTLCAHLQQTVVSGSAVTCPEALVTGVQRKAVAPCSGHLETLSMPDMCLQPSIVSLPALVL